ncbi:MAG: HAD family phosphatase [Lachnospiraceae bacterium]|nr:HAD family phosphatase [Lachnospiraceae bacterium]
MVRLIVTDIDGTLVPEGGSRVNPEYMTVIRELTDLGVRFAAASGRQASSIDVIFHELRDRIYYLGDNGACIQKNGQMVRGMYMEEADLLALLKELREMPGQRLLLSVEEGYYTDDRDEDFHRLVFEEYKGMGKVVEHVEDYADACIKLSLYCEEGARGIYDLLYDRWKDRFTIYVSGARWVDINGLGVTKGEAVRWLQERYEIKPEETVVFGDNYNDISMMRRAVRSYASELSHPDIRQAAGNVVESYEKDGVLKVLKQILKEVRNEK